MLVVMQQGATEEQVEHVINRLMDLDFSLDSLAMLQIVLSPLASRILCLPWIERPLGLTFRSGMPWYPEM